MSNRIVQAATVASLMLLSTIVSVYLLHRLTPGSPQAYAAAALPLGFFAWAFWWMFNNARRCDEMQQRVQFEALAFAFALSLILILAVKLLQRAGLQFSFDLGDLFIDMVLLYFAGLYIAWRRYR
jgi:hypothetical protein